MQKFYSPGKLLTSGEYVVLDGATAFALPTRYGQTLEVKEIEKPVIRWKSINPEGEIWFADTFSISNLTASEEVSVEQRNEVSKMLFLTLNSAAKMRPDNFKIGNGFEIVTRVDFPRSWGLGTSSTLIANLAKWLKIDPYELLEQTFGGSGYDIAVAMHGTALTFEKQGPHNSVLKTSFDPPFQDRLFFVYLNQKQNSRDSIKQYRKQDKKILKMTKEKISALTHRIITCTDLLDFELLLEVHENLISQLLGIQKVKSRLFPDYQGSIKSLGAWGGDFVLVTGSAEEMEYFKSKGYDTVLPYKEMISS